MFDEVINRQKQSFTYILQGTRKIAPWKITPRKITTDPNPNPNLNPKPRGNLMGGNLPGGNFPVTVLQNRCS